MVWHKLLCLSDHFHALAGSSDFMYITTDYDGSWSKDDTYTKCIKSGKIIQTTAYTLPRISIFLWGTVWDAN